VLGIWECLSTTTELQLWPLGIGVWGLELAGSGLGPGLGTQRGYQAPKTLVVSKDIPTQNSLKAA